MCFSRREFLKAGEVPGLLSRCVKQRDAGVAIALRSLVDPFARAAIAFGPDEGSGVEPAVGCSVAPHAAYALSRSHVWPLERRRSGVVRIPVLRHSDG